MILGNLKIVHVQLPAEARDLLPLDDPRKGITHNYNRSMLPSGQRQLALITFGDGEYGAIGILSKEGATARFQDRVRCSFIEETPPISFESLLDRVPSRLKPRAKSGMELEISCFTGVGGRAVLAAAIEIEPSISDALSRVIKHLKSKRSFKVAGNSPWVIVRQEWDAVDTALAVAKMPPSAMDVSLFDRHRPAPILTMLSPHSREDSQIDVDTNSFGGLTLLKTDIRGSREFYDYFADCRVTVINVNRQPIELTLGVDLIVYYARYHSYLLIQYKRLITKKKVIRTRVGHLETSQARYYPSRDANFKLDLQRMSDARKVIGKQTPMAPDDYRLNDDPFYFKFCRSDEINPDSRGMVKGLYILASDLELFLSSKASKGGGGGSSVGFDNLRRRFPNSLFVDLARSGWIGSRTVGSERIQQFLDGSLNSRRSVVMASVRTRIDHGAQEPADEDLSEGIDKQGDPDFF